MLATPWHSSTGLFSKLAASMQSNTPARNTCPAVMRKKEMYRATGRKAGLSDLNQAIRRLVENDSHHVDRSAA